MTKLFDFFLVKIVIGIAAVGGCIYLSESSRAIWVHLPLSGDQITIIIFALDIFLATGTYVLLFRWYEKRPIRELASGNFLRFAAWGFALGLGIQAFAILVLWLNGGYQVMHSNPVSFLFRGMIPAFTAGFVAEILIRGVLFRLMEEKLGTALALVIMMLIFTIAHAGVAGATVIYLLSVIVQAGLMVSCSYVATRSLWVPIFIHSALDFAEPTLFGAINPGISVSTPFLSSRVSGAPIWSGGAFGPGHSLQALILCLLISFFFLRKAKRDHQIIQPFWVRKRESDAAAA